MNTRNVPAQAEKMTMAQEVQRAVETAPSCAPLAAARTKLQGLTDQINAEHTEIERLRAVHAAGNDTAHSRAKDLLAGKGMADEAVAESIRAALRRVDVLKAAVTMHTGTVRQLEGNLSGEVNASLKKARQPLVTRTAAALRELRAVVAEDALIGSELNRYRVPTSDSIEFAPVSQMQYDVRWFAGIKAQGYTV